MEFSLENQLCFIFLKLFCVRSGNAKTSLTPAILWARKVHRS